MNFDKFTIKSQELIQNAQSLASEHCNQQIEPEHLLKVMLDEYYTVRGWNLDTGIPSREKLIELGLEYVADQLGVK